MTKPADNEILLKLVVEARLRCNFQYMTTGASVVTYSSFAPMSPLGSVHLIVVIIIESIFCCICL